MREEVEVSSAALSGRASEQQLILFYGPGLYSPSIVRPGMPV